ncbi:MAG: CDP-alcohol phosphatidyltransferase family protein [Bacteroidota bacterium]|nr:CDP-alcohol phosphatidyltransferase family protein [Bacteroidota bacterium]
MKKHIEKIPIGLIYSRLILGFVILLLSYYQPGSFRCIIVSIIIWAIVSDIFDGIIARKLNISTQKLRRLDSSVDQVFWICTLIGAFLLCGDFFIENYVEIFALLFFEGLTYLVSFIKFKKEVATHAISSKLWTLTIMGTLIQIVLSCNSGLLFNVCIYFGILTRIEVIAILLIIKDWTNDVPSLYHAIRLRQGKKIKRHKLFNG